MNENFIIVTEHPTPPELLDKLLQFAPKFAKKWETSLSVAKDGSFTVHGVFSEFSSFVRDQFGKMDENTKQALFDFVEECVKTNAKSENGISNAACTCFLENIAGEGELSQLIEPYLGPESRKYFDKWNGERPTTP